MEELLTRNESLGKVGSKDFTTNCCTISIEIEWVLKAVVSISVFDLNTYWWLCVQERQMSLQLVMVWSESHHSGVSQRGEKLSIDHQPASIVARLHKICMSEKLHWLKDLQYKTELHFCDLVI